MKVIPTGVFATDKMRAEIAERVAEARKTPVVLMGGIGSPDAASVMWSFARKFIDECAQKCGLPNLEVQYSYNTVTGEFFRPSPSVERA